MDQALQRALDRALGHGIGREGLWGGADLIETDLVGGGDPGGAPGGQRSEYSDRKKAKARAKPPKISTFFWPGVS